MSIRSFLFGALATVETRSKSKYSSKGEFIYWQSYTWTQAYKKCTRITKRYNNNIMLQSALEPAHYPPPHPPTMPVGDSRVETNRSTTTKAGRRRRRWWILLPAATSTASSRRWSLRLLTRRAATTSRTAGSTEPGANRGLWHATVTLSSHSTTVRRKKVEEHAITLYGPSYKGERQLESVTTNKNILRLSKRR